MAFTDVGGLEVRLGHHVLGCHACLSTMSGISAEHSNPPAGYHGAGLIRHAN
jgi:hypothetical protein